MKSISVILLLAITVRFAEGAINVIQLDIPTTNTVSDLAQTITSIEQQIATLQLNPFKRVCVAHDIEDPLTKVGHPWTDNQVERI